MEKSCESVGLMVALCSVPTIQVLLSRDEILAISQKAFTIDMVFSNLCGAPKRWRTTRVPPTLRCKGRRRAKAAAEDSHLF